MDVLAGNTEISRVKTIRELSGAREQSSKYAAKK
jgi:hypothetical protein